LGLKVAPYTLPPAQNLACRTASGHEVPLLAIVGHTHEPPPSGFWSDKPLPSRY
jgi:hypothetical protein